MTGRDMGEDSQESYRVVSLCVDDVEVTQYVIDTNVISQIERLVRGGTADATTLKAAALCRDLADRPWITIVDEFAWIEGSSFHQAAGLSPTSIVIRDVAARLLESRPRDLVATVHSISGWRLPDGYDENVRRNLDDAISAMQLTVIPCYLAALVLEERYGNTSPAGLTADDVIDVLTVLHEQLNYVPGVLFAALKLACLGTPDSRTAAMRVLKTGRKSPKVKEYLPIRNALSAAWDLGVLQLLSVKLSQRVNAALVTSDNALADIAERINVLPFGGVVIRDDALANSPKSHVDTQRIDSAYACLRGAATPSIPTRLEIAAALRHIETRIGSASTLPNVLEKGMHLHLPPMQISNHDIQLLTNLLVTGAPSTQRDALEELLEDDYEALRSRFDSVLMISGSIVAVIADRAAVSPIDVLQPLARRDEHGYDVAAALLSFCRAEEEPFTIAVYRELLRRPDAIRAKLTSIAAGTYVITAHWSEVLGLDPALLSQEAGRRLRSCCDADLTSAQSGSF